MAFHKLPEFALMCGLKRASLSTYIKRGKVLVKDGLIDDSLQQNADFIKKCLENQKKKLEGETKLVADLEPNESETKQNTQEVNKTAPKSDKDVSPDSLYALDKQKKALDIEKIKEEIEILKVKKDKLHGIVIPTELVKLVFTQHSKSILSSFHNAADTFLTMIAKKKGLNINEVAELRGELIGVINTAVNDSVEESKSQIKNIVNEYSEKKGMGEREL